MNYSEFLSKFVDVSPYFPKKGREIITGTNGLYGEKETPFRMLSHWAIVLKDINMSKEFFTNFLDLFLDNFNDHDTTVGPFKARESLKKDTSNGLIGTAWNIEGIVSVIEMCRHYKIEKYRNAEDIFIKILKNLCCHYEYSESNVNWPNIIEPDGKVLGLDRTFNHQLWFAASRYEASKLLDGDLPYDVEHFIANLNKNLKKNHVGTIYHTLGTYPHYHKTYIKRLVSKKYRNDMILKEYGYHAFNLLGFVRLYDNGINSISKVLLENCEVTKTNKFRNNQNDNIYGSSYNPVGIEIAAALSKFRYDDKDILFWINYHFRNFFNNKAFLFERTNDKQTLNARIYEITYLSERTKGILNYDIESNEWFFLTDKIK